MVYQSINQSINHCCINHCCHCYWLHELVNDKNNRTDTLVCKKILIASLTYVIRGNGKELQTNNEIKPTFNNQQSTIKRNETPKHNKLHTHCQPDLFPSFLVQHPRKISVTKICISNCVRKEVDTIQQLNGNTTQQKHNTGIRFFATTVFSQEEAVSMAL